MVFCSYITIEKRSPDNLNRSVETMEVMSQWAEIHMVKTTEWQKNYRVATRLTFIKCCNLNVPFDWAKKSCVNLPNLTLICSVTVHMHMHYAMSMLGLYFRNL